MRAVYVTSIGKMSLRTERCDRGSDRAVLRRRAGEVRDPEGARDDLRGRKGGHGHRAGRRGREDEKKQNKWKTHNGIDNGATVVKEVEDHPFATRKAT